MSATKPKPACMMTAADISHALTGATSCPTVHCTPFTKPSPLGSRRESPDRPPWPLPVPEWETSGGADGMTPALWSPRRGQRATCLSCHMWPISSAWPTSAPTSLPRPGWHKPEAIARTHPHGAITSVYRVETRSTSLSYGMPYRCCKYSCSTPSGDAG